MQQHKLTAGLALAALLGIGLATPAYAENRGHIYERGYAQGHRDAYRHEGRHDRWHDRRHDDRRHGHVIVQRPYAVRHPTYVVAPLAGHRHDRYCGHRSYVAPPPRPVPYHHGHGGDVGWRVVIQGGDIGLRF